MQKRGGRDSVLIFGLRGAGVKSELEGVSVFPLFLLFYYHKHFKVEGVTPPLQSGVITETRFPYYVNRPYLELLVFLFFIHLTGSVNTIQNFVDTDKMK